MKVASRPPRTRSGFTLLELIVVMVVFCLLVGLLLPAVQAARESARRSLCSKNLGQLTLATLAFESANGGFPASSSPGRPYRAGDRTVGSFSPQCMILIYLDQANLYNSINFNLPMYFMGSSLQHNQTAASQSVGTFLCPSDPQIRSVAPAQNSYRACIGLGGMTRSFDGYRPIDNGVFASPYSVNGGEFASGVLPLSAIRDGLSNTLAYSEKPIGSDSIAAGSPFRDWYFRNLDEETLTADQWALACSALIERDLQIGAGATWIVPNTMYTHFFAAESPNSLIPDCGAFAISNGLGIFTARSYHAGGVNASMTDGSVRWFSSTIQIKIWQSLGTRAGGETF